MVTAEPKPVLPPQWCQWPRKPVKPPPEAPKPSATVETRTKVIDGFLYARHTEPYAYTASIHALNNGQVEAGIRPQYGWSEVAALTPGAHAAYLEACQNPATPTAAELADSQLANRERATRRARSKVRRRCKHQGLIEILTLTYRENQTDRVRMARDLDVFLKRVRRVIPTFEYVAVFERQKRGAWHAHLAVRRVLPLYVVGSGKHQKMVKSFDLLRSMWRGVVGADNGNIDVSKRRKQRWSPAKIAGYISKYIGKSFGDNLKYENSYSASNGSMPEPVRFSFANLSDAIGGLFSLLSVELQRGSDLYHKLFPNTSYWMSASPPVD